MKSLTEFRYSQSQSVLNLIYLGFLTVFFLNSCTSLQNIEIEIAVQPKHPLADDIKSLALLNRSMTKQFANNKTDTLAKTLIDKAIKMDSVFQDSIAADTVILVTAQLLYESGRFDVVVPKERNIIRTDRQFIANPINADFTKELCKDFDVDAVLVLESFTEHLEATQSNTSNNGEDQKNRVAKDYLAVNVYNSDWRLYRPNVKELVLRFQANDTIFWWANSFTPADLYFQMPKIKVALIDGGIAAAYKMSGLISPEWIKLNRNYYRTGNWQIDSAIPLIKNNKWEEAATIWEKYATISSKTTRSKVEFNLALAAEMNDALDLAIEWGNKSYKSRPDKALEGYLKLLDNKRKEQQKEDLIRY